MNLLPTAKLFLVGWRYVARHPWQTGLMIFGIGLGVAVVIAIDIANASARRAFDLSSDSVAGRATHQISGTSQDVSEHLYSELRAAYPAIPMAPVVNEIVSSDELGDLPLQLLGLDPFAEGPFRNYFNPSARENPLPGLARFITEPGAVIISARLADRFGLSGCITSDDHPETCRISLEIGGVSRPVTVAGLISAADGLSAQAIETLVLADLATAQELTGKIGVISHIDLILPEDSGELLDTLADSIPPSVTLVASETRSGALYEITSAFRLNLTALSLLALIVGLFLIYNTMTISTLRRRSLFGVLRCLGVTRREIYAMVLGEALLVGIVGSVLGILLGIFLGQESVRLVSQTINDLYFVVSVQASSMPASSLIKGGLLGIITTLVAAYLPAREAASSPPRTALLRSALETKSRSTVRLAAWVGLAAGLLGALALWLPGRNLTWSFIGTFLVIIGFASLTPAATVLLMGIAVLPLGRLAGLLGRMAPRNVVAAISRTSVATAALMVAVSVTIGISLMINSFRSTVVDWLDQTLNGDIYISPPTVAAAQTSYTILPEIYTQLEDWPGIERIEVIRVTQVGTPGGPIQLGATTDGSRVSERPFLFRFVPEEETESAFLEGALLVSEPLARRLGLLTAGETLTLDTPSGPETFPIAGVYYDYGSTQGMALIDREVYLRRWGDSAITAISLTLAEDSDPSSVTRELQEELTTIQRLDIQPNGALRASALEIFDRTFRITTSLQGLATLVAFVGVLSALLSLQLEKTRELGIMSAIGVTNRQLGRLVLLETGLMGGIAGVMAIPTGAVLSLILTYIINRRAFGWTIQLTLSPGPFIEAIIIAMVAAILAGIYPALRLRQIPTAAALRSE